MTARLIVEITDLAGPDFVFIRTRGVFNVADLDAAQTELSTNPHIRAGARVLNDARQVEFSAPSNTYITAGQIMQTNVVRETRNRVALVVSSALGVGSLRMYLGFRGDDGGTGVFRTIAEGIAWLELPPEVAEMLPPD